MSGPREGVQAHYTPSIGAYRRFWAPVLREMGRPLLADLASPAVRGGGRRILDVGCGPGTLFKELSVLAGGSGQLIGADLTRAMLAEAQKNNDVRADLVCCDAVRLPFPDHRFDLVVSVFVLHHVREQQRALAEICRVLDAERGEVALAVWSSRDDENRAFEIFEELLDKFGAPSEDPLSLPVWEKEIDTPERLERLLRSAGLEPLQVRVETPAHQWTAETFLGYRLGLGASRRRFEKLPPVTQQRFRERARKEIGALGPCDLLWRPGVIYGVARR